MEYIRVTRNMISHSADIMRRRDGVTVSFLTLAYTFLTPGDGYQVSFCKEREIISR